MSTSTKFLEYWRDCINEAEIRFPKDQEAAGLAMVEVSALCAAMLDQLFINAGAKRRFLEAYSLGVSEARIMAKEREQEKG